MVAYKNVLLGENVKFNYLHSYEFRRIIWKMYELEDVSQKINLLLKQKIVHGPE